MLRQSASNLSRVVKRGLLRSPRVKRSVYCSILQRRNDYEFRIACRLQARYRTKHVCLSSEEEKVGVLPSQMQAVRAMKKLKSLFGTYTDPLPPTIALRSQNAQD